MVDAPSGVDAPGQTACATQASPSDLASDRNPYVGPRAFRTGEPLYGRRREQRQLAQTIVADRVVLLHSPSGAGKSSLINAALTLEMRESWDFSVLPPCRVNLPPDPGARKPDNRFIRSLVRSLTPETETDGQDKTLPPGTLTDILRQRLLAEEGRSTLLTIDQFEEVLTLDPADIEAKKEFFQALGHAIKQLDDLFVLLAIREDYLAALSSYADYLPTQLRSRFRLDFLAREAAEEAIREPARLAFCGSEAPDPARAVTYEKSVSEGETRDAVARLLDELTRIGEPDPSAGRPAEHSPCVEPVYLQVVCRRLWNRLGPDPGTVITRSDIDRMGDVGSALSEFYDESLDLVAGGDRGREWQIRDFVDERLISEGGVRLQVLWSPKDTGLSDELIKALLNSYILRAEKRHGQSFLELSHDRLVAPALKSNRAWRTAHLAAVQLSARRWEANHRRDEYLLQGKPLKAAEAELVKKNIAESSLKPMERDFLERCRQVRRRRLFAAGGILGLALVMGALALASYISLLEARYLKREADTAGEVANIQREHLDHQNRNIEALRQQMKASVLLWGAEKVLAEEDELAALAFLRELRDLVVMEGQTLGPPGTGPADLSLARRMEVVPGALNLLVRMSLQSAPTCAVKLGGDIRQVLATADGRTLFLLDAAGGVLQRFQPERSQCRGQVLSSGKAHVRLAWLLGKGGPEGELLAFLTDDARLHLRGPEEDHDRLSLNLSDLAGSLEPCKKLLERTDLGSTQNELGLAAQPGPEGSSHADRLQSRLRFLAHLRSGKLKYADSLVIAGDGHCARLPYSGAEVKHTLISPDSEHLLLVLENTGRSEVFPLSSLLQLPSIEQVLDNAIEVPVRGGVRLDAHKSNLVPPAFGDDSQHLLLAPSGSQALVYRLTPGGWRAGPRLAAPVRAKLQFATLGPSAALAASSSFDPGPPTAGTLTLWDLGGNRTARATVSSTWDLRFNSSGDQLLRIPSRGPALVYAIRRGGDGLGLEIRSQLPGRAPLEQAGFYGAAGLGVYTLDTLGVFRLWSLSDLERERKERTLWKEAGTEPRALGSQGAVALSFGRKGRLDGQVHRAIGKVWDRLSLEEPRRIQLDVAMAPRTRRRPVSVGRAERAPETPRASPASGRLADVGSIVAYAMISSVIDWPTTHGELRLGRTGQVLFHGRSDLEARGHLAAWALPASSGAGTGPLPVHLLRLPGAEDLAPTISRDGGAALALSRAGNQTLLYLWPLPEPLPSSLALAEPRVFALPGPMGELLDAELSEDLGLGLLFAAATTNAGLNAGPVEAALFRLKPSKPESTGSPVKSIKRSLPGHSGAGAAARPPEGEAVQLWRAPCLDARMSPADGTLLVVQDGTAEQQKEARVNIGGTRQLLLVTQVPLAGLDTPGAKAAPGAKAQADAQPEAQGFQRRLELERPLHRLRISADGRQVAVLLAIAPNAADRLRVFRPDFSGEPMLTQTLPISASDLVFLEHPDRLLLLHNDRTVSQVMLDAGVLLGAVSRRAAACAEVKHRTRYLAESETTAAKNHDHCQRLYGPQAPSSSSGPGAGTRPPEAEPPEVSLLTVLSGGDLFSRGGHSLLLVHGPAQTPDELAAAPVYDFAEACWGQPAGLAAGILLGTQTMRPYKRGWLEVQGTYLSAGQNCTYAQKLLLSPEERRALAKALAQAACVDPPNAARPGPCTRERYRFRVLGTDSRLAETKKSGKSYKPGNCATRVLEPILAAAFSGNGGPCAGQGDACPLQELARRLKGGTLLPPRPILEAMLDGEPLVQILSSLLMGRDFDAPKTAFEYTFLPEGLALGLQAAGLASEPRLLSAWAGKPLHLNGQRCPRLPHYLPADLFPVRETGFQGQQQLDASIPASLASAASAKAGPSADPEPAPASEGTYPATLQIRLARRTDPTTLTCDEPRTPTTQPSAGASVPLRSGATWTWLVLVLLLPGLLGLYQVRRRGRATLAGFWLLLFSTITGLAGLFVFTVASLNYLKSGDPALYRNELLLSLPPTDLWLIVPAVFWMRGRLLNLQALILYVWARGLLMAGVLVLHLVGVFVQRPLVWPLLSGLGIVLTLLMIREIKEKIVKQKNDEYNQKSTLTSLP